ncbi:hypothetical protein U9M48_008296 [Paspalum notatum var. saurae]|uniref:Uncharacterized protein n=1 Tax=Paspalum notatum var. saurae TaxID=547442 RepID=A0AAQ3WD59_PASNO
MATPPSQPTPVPRRSISPAAVHPHPQSEPYLFRPLRRRARWLAEARIGSTARRPRTASPCPTTPAGEVAGGGTHRVEAEEAADGVALPAATGSSDVADGCGGDGAGGGSHCPPAGGGGASAGQVEPAAALLFPCLFMTSRLCPANVRPIEASPPMGDGFSAAPTMNNALHGYVAHSGATYD